MIVLHPIKLIEMNEALATMVKADRQAVVWDFWQGFSNFENLVLWARILYYVISDWGFLPHKPTTLFFPEVSAL